MCWSIIVSLSCIHLHICTINQPEIQSKIQSKIQSNCDLNSVVNSVTKRLNFSQKKWFHQCQFLSLNRVHFAWNSAGFELKFSSNWLNFSHICHWNSVDFLPTVLKGSAQWALLKRLMSRMQGHYVELGCFYLNFHWIPASLTRIIANFDGPNSRY